MNDDAMKLLMMFINDAYSASGKITRKTTINMIRFIGSEPELQKVVNIGDTNSILNFKIKDEK